MTKVAMLLDGAISHDHRVIKMIQTISQTYKVDLYCLEDGQDHQTLNFSENVRVFKTKQKVNFGTKFLRHSYFCYEFAFFYKKVMNSKINYDFIWANDLPTLVPANACANALNAKLIYDSHEIFIETINQFFPAKASLPKSVIFGWLKNIMKRHGRKIENKLIQKADHFITVNGSLLDWFKKEYGIHSGHVIMNIPRLKIKEIIPYDFRAEFGFDQKDKILLYQGNLNQGRGLELLIETTKSLPKEYKLILIGNGPLEAELKSKSDENQVKYLDTVSIEELPNYTAGADIGINFLEPINLSKKMASPNKLFEYIHAGLPVLATDGLENQKIVDTYQVGVLCDLNSTSMIESLRKFTPAALKQFAENCSKAKSELKWENQEEEVLSLFKSDKK